VTAFNGSFWYPFITFYKVEERSGYPLYSYL
jgi:hypothetical protein